MAARNRPRGNASKEDPADAHEERNMWNQIMIDVKKLSAISAKAKDNSKAVIEKEASMGEGEHDPVAPQTLLASPFCLPPAFPTSIGEPSILVTKTQKHTVPTASTTL